MTEEEFHSLLKRQAEDATNYCDEELTEFRIKALDYYHGEPFGNETEGRSKVVLTEVADTVEFLMPSLMRIFASSDTGSFEPQAPEDVEGARQATDYCAFQLWRRNSGFVVLHNAIKDSLLSKIGIVKSWWDASIDVTEETYENISASEYEALMADPDIEIVEQTESVVVDEMGPAVAYTCKVRKSVESGRIVVDNVPNEEFLVEKRARPDVQRLRFCAHRTSKPVSDLVAMGIDRETAEKHAGSSKDSTDTEKQTRFKDLDSDSDEKDDEVQVTECYIRADYDDDGIDELRRVLCLGDEMEIVENEPWDRIPFDVGSPILMPHRLIGRSVAELVMDIQLIKSTVLRQLLDNVYLNNNQRWAAVEGQVNFDDLLNNVPGGVVRIRQQGAVQPLAPTLMIGETFPLLGYLDETREQRTGISKASAGLDADALQSSTLEAVRHTLSVAQGKTEMIARVYAETLVQGIYRSIFHLAQKHVRAPAYIRLRGQFVPVDPRAWANDYDFEVKVGLGTGQTQERIGALSMIVAKQTEILGAMPDNPIVKPHQMAASLQEMTRLSGFKDADRFFQPPEAVLGEMQAKSQQPPQPDPKLVMETQKAQAQVKLDQWKAEQQVALERWKAEQNAMLRREELERESELRKLEIVLKPQQETSTNLPRAQ